MYLELRNIELGVENKDKTNSIQVENFEEKYEKELKGEQTDNIDNPNLFAKRRRFTIVSLENFFQK